MKKRLFAVLLALTLALSLLPVAVFADGEDAAASNAQQEQQQEVVCVCEAACTAEGMNADCPICGAEGAAVERCGKYAAPAEDKAAQPADEEQPDTGAPDADKPAVEPAVQSADQGIAIQAAHTHCICGGNVNAGDHTAHSDVTYTAWNGTSGISYTNNTAYVYLTGNATLNSDLIVDGRTLYLCLNGKTLSSNGEKKIKVRNNARLVLCDCQGGGTFKGATKNVWGGACIYLYTSTLDMFGGKLTGGKVTGKGGGGAIALDDKDCVFNMYGGEISKNDGNKAGGAIFRTFGSGVNQAGGTFNMYGGTIKDNKAQNGGAFYSVTASTVNLAGGTISGNQSTSTANNDYTGGGAIYLRGGGKLTISGTQITGNSAKKDGGAIFTGCRNFTISGSANISNNTAGRRGGAVCLYSDSGLDAKLDMTGGTISRNSATNDGGGVYVGKKCILTLSGTAFTGNKAKWGGAIYLTDNSSMTMTSGTLTQNTASEQGGGVFSYSDSSSCALSGGTIESNTAGKNGGAVYINKGALKISGTPIIKNNTVSGKANNVSLPSGKTLTISGAMSSGAFIGVTTENTNYPVVFSNAYDTDYSGYFFSDAGKEILYNSSKQLEIGKNIVHTCSGGTATCTTQAICSTCGKPYGTVDANNHDWGAWAPKDNDTHSRVCSRCKAVDTKEHDWDNGKVTSQPTCMKEGEKTFTCTVCGKTKMEPISATGHNWKDAWTSDATHHWHECANDNCDAKNSYGEHTGGTATCTKKAVCKDCKAEYGSVLEHDLGEPSYTWTPVPDGYMCVASSKCKNCSYDVADVASVTYAVTKMPTCLEEGTGRYTAMFSDAFGFPTQTKDVTLSATGHDWAAATCTTPKTCKLCRATEGKALGHTGGKANCHAKAVCEVCQQAYGELNPANHDGGTELRNAKAATYTSTGYTGDTYCKGCNTKLSSGTVIPKLSSGAPAPVKPAAPGKTVQSGKTGDAGVALYAGMALLSLTGCAWLRRKGK